MPLATKNNAIIVKDGKLAENCECCGGWYCCDCTSCASGALPNAINISFTLKVSDGVSQIPLRMVRATSDVRMTPFQCGIYVAAWGVGANPAWTGYQSPQADISFTFGAEYGNAQIISFGYSGRVSLMFTGACYEQFGFTQSQNRIELITNDLNGYLQPFLWRLKDGVNVADGTLGTGDRVYLSPDEYVSRGSGACYSDMPALTEIPVRAGLFYSQYDGTISVAVTSVE